MTDTATSNNLIPTKIDPTSARYEKNMRAMAEMVTELRNQRHIIRMGGGEKSH